MESEEHPDTWELLNEELRYRLDVQRASGQRIETKAAVIIGAALTAMQFVAKQPMRSYWLPAAVLAYLAAMGAGLFAVRPQPFDEIGAAATVKGLWNYPRGRAAAELANGRLRAHDRNHARHVRRLRWLTAAVGAIVAAAALSVAHLTQGVRTDAGRATAPASPAAPGTGSAAP